MQEQVLAGDCLVEVEARLAGFLHYGLFLAVALLQLLHLVEVFGADVGLMVVFRVDAALFEKVPCERGQLAFLLVELALAELYGFFQVVDLVFGVLPECLLLGLVSPQLDQIVGQDLPDVGLMARPDTRRGILALVDCGQKCLKNGRLVFDAVFGRIDTVYVHFVLRHDIRLVPSDQPELHSLRFLCLESIVVLVAEDDPGLADISLVDGVRAQWTLLPSVLLLEVEVLEQARIAVKMAALGNTRSHHEPRRFHADRTLRFLVAVGLVTRLFSLCGVDDLDHVFPLDDGTRVAQVLHVALLLLPDNIGPFFSLLLSPLLRRLLRANRACFLKRQRLIGTRSEGFQDVAESGLLDLLQVEQGLMLLATVAAIPPSVPLLVLVGLVIVLETQQVSVVFDTGSAPLGHSTTNVPIIANPLVVPLASSLLLSRGRRLGLPLSRREGHLRLRHRACVVQCPGRFLRLFLCLGGGGGDHMRVLLIVLDCALEGAHLRLGLGVALPVAILPLLLPIGQRSAAQLLLPPVTLY